MTKEEREYLEMLYAGFAMMGFIIRGEHAEDIPDLSKRLAKKMLEDEIGIVAIKKRKDHA